MSKIKLKPLNLDLTAKKYARDMGEGKIRHYSVSLADYYVMDRNDKTVEAFVAKHVLDTEGLEVEFLLEEPFTSPIALDCSDTIFKDHPAIKKALNKFNTNSTIYARETPPPLSVHISHYAARFANFVISGLNKVLRIFPNKESLFVTCLNVPAKRICEFTPCTYLTVGYTEGEEEAAALRFIQDLSIINSYGAILGQVSNPALVPLSDTVGNGIKTYAIYCAIFIDKAKIQKSVKGDDRSDDILVDIGVRGVNYEGSISWLHGINPNSGYVVETISLSASPEEMRKRMIAVYERTMDNVRERAEKLAKR